MNLDNSNNNNNNNINSSNQSQASQSQQRVASFSEETTVTFSTPSPVTQIPISTLPVSIPRSLIITDHRVKNRVSAVDHDGNTLSGPIKRTQGASNIQDLDEDSPVTFVIEPNECHHSHILNYRFGRKRDTLKNSFVFHRPSGECFSSNNNNKQQTNSIGGGDESDTRSESSEKTPEFIEEDRPILSGIHVKGATLNRLVRILIDSFQTDGTVIDDSEYPSVFFLTHKWIMESEHLSHMLYDQYKHNADDYKKAVHPQEKQLYRDSKLRVCRAYNYWIKKFPIHFDADKRLKEACEKLQNLIELTGDSDCKDLVSLSELPSFDWMRQMTVRNQTKSKTSSLGFNHIEPQTLAAQLTYIEWKFLRRITFSDYKTYAIKNTLQDNPRLERSIQFFNGLSTWIQCMVLSKFTPKQRAEVIHKFLDVAKHLKELHNYNTCLAVIGGISHSALARLSKTMMCLSTEDIKFLGEMTDLLSSNSNYAQYRRSLAECEGFKIPIIGVHLKDIISLHVALQDRLEYDLINFRKLAQLSITFRTLTNLQLSMPPVQPNHDLINLLTLSLDLSYTDDEIYELSLAREPRSSVSSPDPMSKSLHPSENNNESGADVYKKKDQVPSPVFADWAAGVSQTIDIQTIKSHVNAMVEAVFTNYDHDRDGYISHKEFIEIAQNFPFIDTFAVLDADQDGMISKIEMRNYFLRAKYHDLKGEFKHDFHEITYFKPTFCVHCTGLLWGVIKQGWKCKDCGINAHRHCKDQVVMECRQKRSHTVNKQGSVGDSRGSRVPSRKIRKQKGTQTEETNSSSTSSSSDTSESCTSSSEDEQPAPMTHSSEKPTHHYPWNLRKPSSLKRRKQISSDSNDDYFYTHPPSPLQGTSSTTINSSMTNSSTVTTTTNSTPAPQLIPRGPLICSDNFEKWNDRCFTWNRSVPLNTSISTISNPSTASAESTITKHETNEQLTHPSSDQSENYIRDDVSDEDACFTSISDDKRLQPNKTSTNVSTIERLSPSKSSLTESQRSLQTKPEPSQMEIFERLRQAEEEKKRLEDENRAMKQELVRTKSQISSLKREMSSIQQLHLAQQQQQQQIQIQLSAPSMMSNRQELHHHLHPDDQPLGTFNLFYLRDRPDQTNRYHHRHQQMTTDMKKLSTSSNDELLVSPTISAGNSSCSTQTPSISVCSTITATANETQSSRPSISLTNLSTNPEGSASPSDEQLRLYLTETLQREKDSAV